MNTIRSRIDGTRIEMYGEQLYKVTEPDHLGFCEVLENIHCFETFKAYEKMLVNSLYGQVNLFKTEI